MKSPPTKNRARVATRCPLAHSLRNNSNNITPTRACAFRALKRTLGLSLRDKSSQHATCTTAATMAMMKSLSKTSGLLALSLLRHFANNPAPSSKDNIHQEPEVDRLRDLKDPTMYPAISSLHGNPLAPHRRINLISNHHHSKDNLAPLPRASSSSSSSSSSNIRNHTSNLSPTTAPDNGPAMATATRRHLIYHKATRSPNKRATAKTHLLARRLARLLLPVVALHLTTRNNSLRCTLSRKKQSALL